MGRVGQVFAQPQPTRNSNGLVGSSRRRVVVSFGWNSSHRNPSKCGEISPNLVRSCQIHPRSNEIPSDPVRFLPNCDEKSLVQLGPVFIVPEIEGFKWKRGRNLEKNVLKSGKKWPDMEKWPESRKNGWILNGLRFGSGFTGFKLKNQ